MKANTVLALLAAIATSSGAPTLHASQETVDLKIVKSYSGLDGSARFCSYLIEWKGQEVVVVDPRATTKLKSDDVLSVLVISHWNSNPVGPLGILTFIVSPAKYRGTNPPLVDAQNSSSKPVAMTLTKVLSAQDGALVHRSYLGDWNGREVAISDDFGTTNFAVGDTVPVTVTRIPFEAQGEHREAITFRIAARPQVRSPR